MNRDKESDVKALKQNYENKIREIDDKFAMELKTEREKIENEKKKDLAAYEEIINGNINEKHKSQLKLLNEQHSRELETLSEELVKTHMEKFTLMTEQLEQAHQVRTVLYRDIYFLISFSCSPNIPSAFIIRGGG